MKIINTKLHGIIDYASALVLLLPWIVDFHPSSEDTWILTSIGSAIAVYSLITNYEFGMVKIIPMRTHLVFDIVISIFLISTPFVFNLYHYSKWPVIVGIIGLIVSALTNPVPYKVTRKDLNITMP